MSLPGRASGENLNEMPLMTGLPGLLLERAMIVKNGVEGKE